MVSLPVGYYVFGREEIIQVLNEKLSQQLAEDPLTRAMSRRAFFDLFPSSKPVSDGIVMIADLDFFKTINDTYGHAAGDAVLVQSVAIIRRVLGDKGWVARLGGEEFAIWLHDPDTVAARRVAQTICKSVARGDYEWQGTQIKCTVSIGACFARRGQSIDSALSRADTALYRAKSAGRDRSEFHNWQAPRVIRKRMGDDQVEPVDLSYLETA